MRDLRNKKERRDAERKNEYIIKNKYGGETKLKITIDYDPISPDKNKCVILTDEFGGNIACYVESVKEGGVK